MRYIGFAELAANAWSAVALESILRVVAVAPEQFTSHYSLKMDWIRVRLSIVLNFPYLEICTLIENVRAGFF